MSRKEAPEQTFTIGECVAPRVEWTPNIPPPVSPPAGPPSVPPPPAAPATPPPGGKLNVKTWRSILAGVAIVIAFIVTIFGNRNSRQHLQQIPLDPQVPDVRLWLDDADFMGKVQYQNGTMLPRDALGSCLVTLDDNLKNPERLKAYNIAAESFPVVVFFNVSGFDATGEPLVIRRAKDGSAIVPLPGNVKLARAVIPQRDGGFTILHSDNTTKMVTAQEWYSHYMHLTEAAPGPAGPAGGPANPGGQGIDGTISMLEETTVPVDGKQLVSRQVKRVSVPVHVYRGRIKPFKQLPALQDAVGLVVSWHSDSQGKFREALAPGLYTLVIEYKGQAVQLGTDAEGYWPTFTVKEGIWTPVEVIPVVTGEAPRAP